MTRKDLERYITAYQEMEKDEYTYNLTYEYLMCWKDDNTFKVLNLIELLVDLNYDFETIFEILEGGNYIQ